MQDIGVPVINSGNIQSDNLDTSELKFWYLNDPQGAKVENYFLEDGDILLNFINSFSQIGKSCIYRKFGRQAIYTTNIFRIKAGNNCLPDFLHLTMLEEKFQREIQTITKPAVNQASFTKEELGTIKLVIPPILEQNKIISQISSIEKFINKNKQKLNHLVSLKKSLMQDLLTGKVRVQVN
jgi:type I restriction enzyme S subunit